MPPLSPVPHAPKIPTRPRELPPRHAAQLVVHRLEIRVRGADERLAQVVEAVAQVVRVRSRVMVVDMLHLVERAV